MERAALEATATPPPQAPSHAPGSADGRKWYVEYVVHANAAITLLGWVRYWSRRRWMPYHGQVAGLRWHELGPSLQLLFLTMSRTASTACALCALSTVALFREGRLPVDRLMSGTLALDQINEGFDRLAEGSVARLVVNL